MKLVRKFFAKNAAEVEPKDRVEMRLAALASAASDKPKRHPKVFAPVRNRRSLQVA